MQSHGNRSGSRRWWPRSRWTRRRRGWGRRRWWWTRRPNRPTARSVHGAPHRRRSNLHSTGHDQTRSARRVELTSRTRVTPKRPPQGMALRHRAVPLENRRKLLIPWAGGRSIFMLPGEAALHRSTLSRFHKFAALWGGHSCLRPSFQLGWTRWKAGPPARQPTPPGNRFTATISNSGPRFPHSPWQASSKGCGPAILKSAGRGRRVWTND